MKFYKVKGRTAVPPTDAVFPCIVCVGDNWDDYNFKTLFHLHYFRAPGSSSALGDVKILQVERQTTQLPEEFASLDPQFVSLGQDLEYYKAMRVVFPSKYETILGAINDVVVKPQLLESVETTSGFRNSLLRFNEARISLRDAASVLGNVDRQKGYQFIYRSELPGADADVHVKFDLKPDDLVPGRIAAIIGRNGVGKTQFLARLARDLATPQRMSRQSIQEIESAFSPQRPLFSRVIALSFSAFDKFQRPEPKAFFSYIYCGVRDDSGGLSRAALEAKHLVFLKRIREQERSALWEEQVEQVLGLPADSASLSRTIRELEGETAPSMSSGQSILTYFISAALAYLKEDSLLLFDEPEIHLHPNAVAVLMQALQALLKKFDSYAIVATHSPLVIQEVPRKRVIRFEREANITTAYPLGVESFGESISELTRHVFETVEIPNFYKATLKKLSKQHSYDEVLELFDGQLGLHASAYLASMYGVQRDA